MALSLGRDKLFNMRSKFVILSTIMLVGSLLLSVYLDHNWYVLFGIVVILTIMGYCDMIQTRHTIKRLYPVFGRLRYIMEELRPKMYQYFIESDINGRPFNRVDRSTVYQRAKGVRDTIPFGTQLDVYKEGYEWISHSISPKHFNTLDHDPRIMVGNKDCLHPYSSSILNISAMSFGSLSGNAVEALNWGAKLGNFAHNTGEGGISDHHLRHGGDLIWQIGTGYFGCRDKEGNFDPELYEQKAKMDVVKMIELKISQGAKPGHGGILPASKNSEEIAKIRHILPHTIVESPPHHSSFDTPMGMVKFIKKLRDLSGGKPVGFKLCIGMKSEFISICQAMIQLDTYPDYIAVDGGEGGTGAAPPEFTNYVGAPLLDGLAFVQNILVGMGIREHIKLFASGKITSAFHIARVFALGADACYQARANKLALGCIQALLCNTNRCPTGITTQDPKLTIGLVPKDKKDRILGYHQKTLKNFVELIGAAGLTDPKQITREHIYRRVSLNKMMTYEEIFPSIPKGALLKGEIPEKYIPDFSYADINRWGIPSKIA